VHIIGQQHSARSHELRDLLTRNGIPFEFFPAESDRGRLLLKQSGHAGSALPVVITYAGQALADPKTDELAAAFGLATLPAGIVDVAIVGAGPAGLSTAVYTASEDRRNAGEPIPAGAQPSHHEFQRLCGHSCRR
jgi:thioredoxin reductase (NADPH)